MLGGSRVVREFGNRGKRLGKITVQKPLPGQYLNPDYSGKQTMIDPLACQSD